MSGQIPIETAEPNQLSVDSALKYEEICFIIGSLYLDSHHRTKVMRDQQVMMDEQMKDRIKQLMQENQALRQELANGVIQPSRTFSNPSGSGPMQD